jgi:hypothetical protein
MDAHATLADRMIEQLSPLGPLLERLIDHAMAETEMPKAAKAFPALRRDAHLRRVVGLVRWAEVADGLVAAEVAGELPNGYSVVTTEADHNRGQYSFRFPGGLFTLRRHPHDDAQNEGMFLQQQFAEIVRMMDTQGAPGADETVRVWIKLRPEGDTTFTARDRYGHETHVTLADLLAANVAMPSTVRLVGPAPSRTAVRSNRASDSDSLSN